MIDTTTRTPTFVELPREWLPDSWFADGALRQIPKYDRPQCRLLRALYGHPEAGALWEARPDEITKKLCWFSVPGNGGVYVHAKTKAAMVDYVHDMLLLSSPRDTESLWRELAKSVDYKDPAAPLQRYLGAFYKFDAFDPFKPKAQRSLLNSIDDYAANAVQRFKCEFSQKPTRVTSPYITSEEINEIGQSRA